MSIYPLLPLVLLMTACVHAPSYKEVTPEGDNAFVVSRDSVEPFGSDDEVERVARDYCAASSQVYRQLKRAFRVAGNSGEFFHATNGILQGCPLSVVLLSMLVAIWQAKLADMRVGFDISTGSPYLDPFLTPKKRGEF